MSTKLCFRQVKKILIIEREFGCRAEVITSPSDAIVVEPSRARQPAPQCDTSSEVDRPLWNTRPFQETDAAQKTLAKWNRPPPCQDMSSYAAPLRLVSASLITKRALSRATSLARPAVFTESRTASKSL